MHIIFRGLQPTADLVGAVHSWCRGFLEGTQWEAPTGWWVRVDRCSDRPGGATTTGVVLTIGTRSIEAQAIDQDPHLSIGDAFRALAKNLRCGGLSDRDLGFDGGVPRGDH